MTKRLHVNLFSVAVIALTAFCFAFQACGKSASTPAPAAKKAAKPAADKAKQAKPAEKKAPEAAAKKADEAKKPASKKVVRRQLVANGDFKEWAGGVPKSWKYHGKAGVTEKTVDGKKVAQLEPDAKEDSVLLFPIRTGVAGKTVKVQVKCTSADPGKMGMRLEYKSGGKVVRRMVEHPGDGKAFVIERFFDLPKDVEAGSASVRVFLRGGAKKPAQVESVLVESISGK